MALKTHKGLTSADVGTNGLQAFGAEVLDYTDLNNALADEQSPDFYLMAAGVLKCDVITVSGLNVTLPSGLTYFAKQIWINDASLVVAVADGTGTPTVTYIWGCADGQIRTTSSTTPPGGFDNRSACILVKASALSGVVTLDRAAMQGSRYGDAAGGIVTENAPMVSPTAKKVPTGVTAFVPTQSRQIFPGRIEIAGKARFDGSAYFTPPASATPYARHILNVRDYGATGDGMTDDTGAIQTALTAAQSLPGCQVFFPNGTYRVTNLQTGNLTDVEILGSHATILVTGNGGGATHGFEMTGALNHVLFRGLHFKGQSGSALDLQCGIFSNSGVTLNFVCIENCEFEYLVNSVSFNTNLSGSQFGCTISNCYVHDGLMTSDNSEGYGVHCADGTGNPTNFSVVNCVFDKTARHAVYIAKCVGAAVVGCKFYRHRLSNYTGNPRYACVVQRSYDVTISGCVFENCYDGSLGLTKTAQNGIGYTVTGCVFSNPQNAIPLLAIGSQSPSTSSDGSPTSVTVQGCTFRSDAGSTQDLLRIFSGFRVVVANNHFYLSGQSATTYATRIDTRDETAGTATYSDGLLFSQNIFVMLGSGTNAAVRLASAACTSSVAMSFLANQFAGTLNEFSVEANVTDVNVRVFGQANTGLTMSGTTQLASISSPSAFAAMKLASSLTFYGQTNPILTADSAANSNTTLDFDVAGPTSAQAVVRTFRRTNTTGLVALQVNKGDNTTTVQHQLSGSSAGLSYLAADNGNVAIGASNPGTGGGDGVFVLAQARTNPSSNPTGGIILYWDGTNLKYRKPDGSTGNIV